MRDQIELLQSIYGKRAKFLHSCHFLSSISTFILKKTKIVLHKIDCQFNIITFNNTPRKREESTKKIKLVKQHMHKFKDAIKKK